MLFLRKVIREVKEVYLIHLSIYLFIGVVFSLIPFLAELADTEPERFTRDPVISLNSHPLIGFFSNVGIFFWCGTFFITAFTSVLLRKSNPSGFWFLLMSAFVTLLLLFDDWFLVHDYIFPSFFDIPEMVVYFIYIIIFSGYLIVFFKQILELRFVSLAFAFTFFGLSVLMDVVVDQKDMAYVVEDGFKLAGIVTWFMFFGNASLRLLRKSQAGRPLPGF